MREKTFSAMLAMDETADIENLFLCFPAKIKEEYKTAYNRYKELSLDERRDKAILDLRVLLSSREFTGLSEVHPGWMWEVLKNEPPRIISVILRYLSSSHTKYLIEYMPASVRSSLPPPVDAFRVPPEIVTIIRMKFQNKFLPMFMPKGIKNWSIEHLPYLPLAQIRDVFKNRGLVELALALNDMPRQAHKVVMNRLSLEEANNLKEYLDNWVQHFSELKKSAKFSVLEVETTEDSEMNFIESLGMRGIAKGINFEDKWVTLLRQKLEPKDGYAWQRLVEENLTSTNSLSLLQRKLAEKIIKEIVDRKDKK